MALKGDYQIRTHLSYSNRAIDPSTYDSMKLQMLVDVEENSCNHGFTSEISSRSISNFTFNFMGSIHRSVIAFVDSGFTRYGFQCVTCFLGGASTWGFT